MGMYIETNGMMVPSIIPVTTAKGCKSIFTPISAYSLIIKAPIEFKMYATIKPIIRPGIENVVACISKYQIRVLCLRPRARSMPNS